MFVIITTRPSGAKSLHSRLYRTLEEAIDGAKNLPKAEENRIAVHQVKDESLFTREEVAEWGLK